MTTWLLVAAAVAVQVDLVRSGFSLERARAHDRAILRTLALTAAVLLTIDLVAGLVLSLGVLGYWREGSLRNLLLATGLATVWLVAPVLQPWAWVIALGWLGLALLESTVVLWHWGARRQRPWWPGWTRAERLGLLPLAGLHGQHTLFAAGLALLLPLAWALYPALGVLWMLMLVGISSWVGVLAGLIGLAVVEPMLSPLIGAAIVAALLILLPRFRHDRPSWLDVLPRGDSLDSVRERGRSWRFLLGTMRRWGWRTWLTGRGWDGPNRDLLRARALGRVKYGQGTAHNDVLDLVYTSGLAGLLLLGVLAWRVGSALTLGDPWSAVVVTGLVIALASHALRYPSVGGVWWLACAFVAQGGWE